MGTPPFGSWRNDGSGSGIENGVVEVLGVLGSVGDDVDLSPSSRFLAVDHIAPVTRREHEAHRQAERIDGSRSLMPSLPA